MNARQRCGTKGAEAKASWFVARLYSGEMTGKNEDALFAWLKADASHRRAYEGVLALWDAVGELREVPELKAAIACETPKRLWRKSAVRVATAAAIVLVVAMAAIVTGLFDRSDVVRALARYETAVGEQRSVSLSDGSRLTLNTGSRVLVDYTPLERRIILDFGEVFFEIEKDPKRPLTVVAHGRVLTILGTRFSVHLADNEVKVVVVEGIIAVSNEERRFPLTERQLLSPKGDSAAGTPSRPADLAGLNDVILHAGTIATFREGHHQVNQAGFDEIEQSQSWRSGVVRFDEQPLYVVVSELNRYSQTKILIEDDAIMNLSISGIFRLERVGLILDVLEEVIPVKVVRYSDRYVLVSSEEKEQPPLRDGRDSGEANEP